MQDFVHQPNDYSMSSAPVALVPFSSEFISLPEALEGAPNAVDLLGQDGRRFPEEQERMTRFLRKPLPYESFRK